jgi:hypothetical protein
MAELQQPNIVGNFLAAYSSGLERQQQQQDAAYQRQRQAKADDVQAQQFQWQMDDRQIAAANDRANKIARVALISDTPEKWAMNVPVLMQQLGIDGPAPDFSTRQAKIAEAQSLQEMLKAQMDEREAARQDREANANIAQSYAAARASNRQGQGGGGLGNAPSGYQWVRDANGNLSQAPIKGGPADPAKLQPGELSKIRNSNKQIDELENSLASYINNLEKTTPMGRLFTRGPEVSKVETGHTDLLMQMKNLYELGVLNGPDYFLMTKIVEDPTSLMQLARGTDGLKAQTDTVKSIISRARNLNNDRLQQAGVDAYRNREQPTATTGAPPAAGAANPKTFRYDANGNRVQ